MAPIGDSGASRCTTGNRARIGAPVTTDNSEDEPAMAGAGLAAAAAAVATGAGAGATEDTALAATAGAATTAGTMATDSAGAAAGRGRSARIRGTAAKLTRSPKNAAARASSRPMVAPAARNGSFFGKNGFSGSSARLT